MIIQCNEVPDLLYDYVEGEMEPEVRKALEQKFETCPDCRALLATYRTTIRLLGRLGHHHLPEAAGKRLATALPKAV